MKPLTEHLEKESNLFWQIHEKISSFTAHLIGPFVFSFGKKENSWGLSTAKLLSYPEDSLGKALGLFLKENRLEPIAGAESHDLYHVLFNYPTSLKGEVALQFFLKGNGKNSIASFGVSIGAWIIFPRQWHSFKSAQLRGKQCVDISTLDLKEMLAQNFKQVKASLFSQVKPE
jgi:hypothetical protein